MFLYLIAILIFKAMKFKQLRNIYHSYDIKSKFGHLVKAEMKLGSKSWSNPENDNRKLRNIHMLEAP